MPYPGCIPRCTDEERRGDNTRSPRRRVMDPLRLVERTGDMGRGERPGDTGLGVWCIRSMLFLRTLRRDAALPEE